MKRKLLRQIGNEWTANIWLALELLVVSVVMWYLVDIFFTYSSLYREPRGFDISHCYLINQKKLSPKSPDYVEKESKENKDDFERLYDALESRPDIEAVASGVNAYFYNGSNSAIGMSHPTLEGLDFALIRRITPSFVRVFRLYGSRGETPEQLEKMIIENRNAFFASSNLLGSEEKEPLLHDHIGDQFDLSGDTVVLGGVFKTARYSDYSNGPFNASILVPVETRHLGDYELMVRVKEKMDVDFIDRLMKDADNYRFGNYYIASVQSFDRIRESYQREDENELIKKGIASAFLALNIFLGILGTFWFRTRQRMSEIALRMSFGATRWSVFARVITEGEIVLLLVTPLAILFDWLLTHYELNMYHNGGFFVGYRFTACVIITWALLALMIFLGSLIPARRAMKIAPAVALKDE